MRRWDICWPLVIVIGLIVLTIGFFSFDAGLGQSDGTTARLIAKEYTPPYDTFTPTTDSKGHTTIQHTHYPARYTLVFDDNSETDTSRALYYRLTNGQPCVLTFRRGHWTGCRYGTSVYPANGPMEK